MALALLELTETAAGDVLEQLLVTTSAEAAAHQNRALGPAINRFRLFAQIDGALPGVPPSVRQQLDRAAIGSLAQLTRRRRSAARDVCASFTALWHDGRLQELHSHSLADSLEVWQRRAGRSHDYVLIVLSRAAPAAVATTGRNLERFYANFLEIRAERSEISYRISDATSTRRVDPSPLTPAQQIQRDAAARRDALAAQWLTATEASARLGSQAANGSHRASQMRRNGELLGVYVTQPAPSYRYPTWQFRGTQPVDHPVQHLEEILSVLRNFGPFDREPDGLRRTTGWGEADWFLSPHALLEGATPADRLATDPASVLQAARSEFKDES